MPRENLGKKQNKNQFYNGVSFFEFCLIELSLTTTMYLPASFLEHLIQTTETVQRDRQAGRYTVKSIKNTVRTVSLEFFLLWPDECRSFLLSEQSRRSTRTMPGSSLGGGGGGGRLLKIRDPMGNTFSLISLPRAKILKGLLQTRSVPRNVRCLHQRLFLAQHISNVCTISASLIHQILGGSVEWKLTTAWMPRHALRQSQVHTILEFCPKPPGQQQQQSVIKNHRHASQVILAA